MKEKIIVITGSTSGLGFGIAKYLNAQGAVVIVNGRSQDSVDQAVQMIDGSYGVVGDMTDPKDAKNLFLDIENKYGTVDSVVCNVGGGKSLQQLNNDSVEWLRFFQLNLMSTVNVVDASRSLLRASKGSIVCISSICGLETIEGAPYAYSCSKAALNKYIGCVSKELGKFGVRINGVAPGNLLFEGSTWDFKIKQDHAAINQMLKDKVALNRFGTINDIAYLVAYLCSENSSFMTGSILKIDGGQLHG